jgi:predicted DNA-binding ribbon-helix-helix protein
MKSLVIKRSIVIAGHKTSISLEDAFWKALKDIALAQGTTLSDLVATIDSERRHGNLSSAIRLFVLEHFQARAHGRGDGGHDDNAGAGGAQAESAQTPRQMILLTGPTALQPES